MDNTENKGDTMRAQFEACFADCNLRRVSDRSDCYESTSTAALWEGYQATLRSPAVAGLVEALRSYVDLGHSDTAVREARAALAQFATLTKGEEE